MLKPTTRKNYPAIICFLFFVLIYLSCSKSDNSPTPINAIKKDAYFDVPLNTNSSVTTVANTLGRLNEKSPFKDELIKNAGYAQWEFSKVIKGNASARGEGEDEIVNIPFVKRGDSATSAILVARITDTDTSFEIMYPQQYIQYPMDDDTTNTGQTKLARDYFNVFASYDYKMFGVRKYKITDGRIYGFKKEDTLIATLEDASGEESRVHVVNTQNASLAGSITGCTRVTSCMYVGSSTAKVNIEPHQNNTGVCVTTETCTTVILIGGGGTDAGGSSGITGGGVPGISTGSGSGTPGGNGGGSSTGNGGGGTVPTITPLNPCARIAAANGRLPGTTDPCTAQPWVPLPNGNDGGAAYVMTSDDIRIWNEIHSEKAALDDVGGKDCQGTNRTGNVQWPGVLEHWLIMIDYISRNPIQGQVEYQIPGASSTTPGNRGYADIVNTHSKEIFEIKSDGNEGQGITEVQTYVALANQNCRSVATPWSWSKGANYETRSLPDPRNPLKNIKVEKKVDGVLIYSSTNRVTDPIPITLPQTIPEQIKRLVQKIREKLDNADVIITQFMHENPELANYIKTAAYTAAVSIIVGTIVEDFLTAGVGVLDDWPSFSIAMDIMDFANKL